MTKSLNTFTMNHSYTKKIERFFFFLKITCSAHMLPQNIVRLNPALKLPVIPAQRISITSNAAKLMKIA